MLDVSSSSTSRNLTEELNSSTRYSAFGSRVRTELLFKLQLYIGLTAIFCIPYFTLQYFHLGPIHTLPLSRLDETITWNASAIYLYQSIYFFLPILPFLADSRDDLLRYRRGFLALCIVSFVIFFLYPVAGPRPKTVTGNWLTELVFSYDQNLNAFPSLHAGLATYSVLFGGVIARGDKRIHGVVALSVIWLLGIAYAALATKQHYAIDLVAGAAIAWAAHESVWWDRKGEA